MRFVKNGGIGHGRHQRPVNFFLFSVSDKKEKLMKRYFDNFIYFLLKEKKEDNFIYLCMLMLDGHNGIFGSMFIMILCLVYMQSRERENY